MRKALCGYLRMGFAWGGETQKKLIASRQAYQSLAILIIDLSNCNLAYMLHIATPKETQGGREQHPYPMTKPDY